jgi:hypothetical protein
MLPQWPLWIKIYSVVVGGPMVGICLGLAIWVFTSRFGGLLDNADGTATLLLMVASAMLLCLGAYLFFTGVFGVVNSKVDALLMLATGHLIVAAPGITLLLVDFLRNQDRFLHRLVNAVDDGFIVAELRLIGWVLFHIYLAMILALSDRGN